MSCAICGAAPGELGCKACNPILRNECTWAGCMNLGTNPREGLDNYQQPLNYCDEHAVASDELMRNLYKRNKIKDGFTDLRLSLESLMEEIVDLENTVMAEYSRLEEDQCNG